VCLELARAPRIFLEMRVAAIDEDVAGSKMRLDLRDGGVDHAIGDHEPDGARRCEEARQLGG
jgi:hypothetical protein